MSHDQNTVFFSYVKLPENIQNELIQQTTTKRKIEFLLPEIEANHAINPTLTLALAEYLKYLTQDTKYRLTYAKALYWKSYIINEESPLDLDLQRALTDVKISAGIFEHEKTLVWFSKALNLRALIHYNMYDESTGQIYNEKAQAVLRQVHEQKNSLCNDWGDLYRVSGNIAFYTSSRDTVIDLYERAKTMYEQCNNPIKLARLFANYSFVFEASKDYRVADSLLAKSIHLYRTNGTTNQLAKAYLNFATFHSNRFSRSEDPQWFETSNKLLDTVTILKPNNKTEVYYQSGANFHNYAVISEKQQAAVFFDSVGYFYDLAIDAALKEQNARYLQKTLKQIGKICPNINENICSELIIKSAEASTELTQKAQQSFEYSAEKTEAFKNAEQSRTIRRLVTFLSLASLILIAIFYQRSRVIFLRKQLKNRMEALRSQMNPHFISNSLNAIDSLVNKGNKESASEYLIDFSRLCRLVLNNSKNEFITLTKELETLGYYLRLEQLRMGKRMTYSFDIDEFLITDKILVPPMLLQPFIENAIIHGIQNKQAPGHIWVYIQHHSDTVLEIKIKDSGVGRAKAQELKLKSVLERPSFGISITKERLENMRKMKEAKIIYQDLFDKNNQAIGTEVTINFPLIIHG